MSDEFFSLKPRKFKALDPCQTKHWTDTFDYARQLKWVSKDNYTLFMGQPAIMFGNFQES